MVEIHTEVMLFVGLCWMISIFTAIMKWTFKEDQWLSGVSKVSFWGGLILGAGHVLIQWVETLPETFYL